MQFKNMLWIMCAICIGTVIFYVSNQSGQSEAQETLVIGVASGYAPFVSMNEQGAYEGFDIDVATALAQELGKQLVLKDIGSMSALFMALQQGQIDAIMWGLSITDARLQQVAMIPYQGEPVATYPLIFWQDAPKNISSLSDMAGKTVCVEPASVQQSLLDQYPEVEQLATEKVDDGLLSITYNKADAALVEWAIAKKFQQRYPQLQIVPVALPAQWQEYGIGIAISPSNMQLQEMLRAAVDTLKMDGVIDRVAKKWGMQ